MRWHGRVPHALPIRIVQVYVIEKYWPLRFNFPNELYESLYGQPRPDRQYWRVIREFDVPESAAGGIASGADT